jgi:hypothetical protein
MQGLPVADESVVQAKRRNDLEGFVDAVARHVGVDRVGWAEAKLRVDAAQRDLVGLARGTKRWTTRAMSSY